MYYECTIQVQMEEEKKSINDQQANDVTGGDSFPPTPKEIRCFKCGSVNIHLKNNTYEGRGNQYYVYHCSDFDNTFKAAIVNPGIINPR